MKAAATNHLVVEELDRKARANDLGRHHLGEPEPLDEKWHRERLVVRDLGLEQDGLGEFRLEHSGTSLR